MNMIYWSSRITDETVLAGLLVVIVIFLCYYGKKKEGIILLLGGACMAALNAVLKLIFKIPRPDNPLIEITGYGFPSGHSSFITFIAVLLYYFFARHKGMHYIFLEIFLGLSVVLIATSRLVYRVHTLYDVIGGICLGFLVAWITIRIYKRL